uniref:Uncharacterized protein n=1 Tax=Arundo donax TaxID=35708 RepID=A0A0A9GJ12_ARUDO
MPSRVDRQAFWKSLIISIHSAAVACFRGTLPPPLSRLPMKLSLSTSGDATSRSICVICPIFSASVIRPRRSATRASTGLLASLYSK